MSTFNKKELVPSALSRKSVIFYVFKTEEETTSTTQNTLLSNETTAITNTGDGFHYHTGPVKEIKQYKDIYDVDWGDDYEGFNGEASLSIPYRKKDMQWLYKGVRCQLFVTRMINENDPLTKSFLGFIKDISFSESGVDLQLVSYSILLETPLQLEYKQLPRSQILANVIKSAGLIPQVDPTGLKDELIDWSSVESTSTSSSSTDSSGVTGDGSMTEDEINKLASKVRYVHMGSGHDPKKGFKNLTQDYKGDCYDITAGLYYAFNFKAGIKARDVVAKSNSSKSGTHHCCQIYKDGKWVWPAFYDHCTTNLGINSQMRAGKIDIAREPPNANGDIPPYTKKWP